MLNFLNRGSVILCLLQILVVFGVLQHLTANPGETRDQAFKSRRKSAKNIPVLPRFGAAKASRGHVARLWSLFSLSQQTNSALVQWEPRDDVIWGSWSCAHECWWCCPISRRLSLWQVRLASPHLRFSSHIKQEHSPPSEELGELIKAYSGVRLMPVVQGIVQTLSGVRFGHPSKRWMTVNLSRCREELLGKATGKN